MRAEKRRRLTFPSPTQKRKKTKKQKNTVLAKHDDAKTLQTVEQPQQPPLPAIPPPPDPVYYNYSPLPPNVHIPMWEEPMPPFDREGLWKTACRVRVWEIQRRYSAATIRSVVTQEANDFYVKHGLPRWWGGSGIWVGGQWVELKVGGSREAEAEDDHDIHADADADVASCSAVHPSQTTNKADEPESSDGEDWSEYESELSDSDDALTDAQSGEPGTTGDECDAEGELDPEADPTYNAELSSPIFGSTSSPCITGCPGGQMSSFYVPPSRPPLLNNGYTFPDADRKSVV